MTFTIAATSHGPSGAPLPGVDLSRASAPAGERQTAGLVSPGTQAHITATFEKLGIDPKTTQAFISAGHISPQQKNDIVASLDTLLTRPEGLRTLNAEQRRELARDIVSEVIAPESLNQGMHCSCGAASASYMVLSRLKDPAYYTKMLTEMATVGNSTMLSGDKIMLDARAVSPDGQNVSPPYEPRRLSERILQTSLFNYALNNEASFDVRADISTGTYHGKPFAFTGLMPEHYERMMQGLTGRAYDRIDLSQEPGHSAADMTKRVERDVQLARSEGQSAGTMVEVRWDNSGGHALHLIVVTDMNASTVRFFNPHGALPPDQRGAIQEMSRQDFEERVNRVLVENKSGNPREITAAAPFDVAAVSLKGDYGTYGLAPVENLYVAQAAPDQYTSRPPSAKLASSPQIEIKPEPLEIAPTPRRVSTDELGEVAFNRRTVGEPIDLVSADRKKRQPGEDPEGTTDQARPSFLSSMKRTDKTLAS